MGRDKLAKEIMDATGARYMEALHERRRRGHLGEMKAYMLGVRALSSWKEGEAVRCVRCLAPVHGKCDR